MQCIVVKSDEFENSSPLYIFPLNPDYVAAPLPPQQLLLLFLLTLRVPLVARINELNC